MVPTLSTEEDRLSGEIYPMGTTHGAGGGEGAKGGIERRSEVELVNGL